MPRLVLLEDDGREVFSGDISRSTFVALGKLVSQHGGFIRAAAATLRVVRELQGSAPPPARLRPPPRRKRRGHA
jgi:hypothetical protein